MTLYDIEQEYRETIDALIENGGALTPEIDAAMFISRNCLIKRPHHTACSLKRSTAILSSWAL